MLSEITPVLLTMNEAANVGRTLTRLAWARDIVIVDSGSTDDTLEIIRAFPNVRVFSRLFDSHARQWTYAIEETGIATEWVLRLDADYDVPEALVVEMSALQPAPRVNAYRVAFDYAILSRKLHASLYPANTVLLRRGHFAIEDVGHTERWRVEPVVESLRGRIIHDDHKPLSHWVVSQHRYAAREADYLLRSDGRTFKWQDHLRLRMWPAPVAVFFYVLICKRCILDGWPGWYYALQRLLAETIIALELLHRRLRQGRSSETPVPKEGDNPR